MSDEREAAPTLDAERMLREARSLSFPRYPGTDGDRKAIAFVAKAMGDAGLVVTQEEFSYDLRRPLRALRAVLVGCGLLVGASGWVALSFPLGAGVILGLAVLTAATFLGWAPWIEDLYRRDGPTRTANVVGRRPSPKPRMTLILMAHHDSKSQNLTLPWRLGLTLLALAGGLVLIVLLLKWQISGVLGYPAWLLPASSSSVAVAIWTLSTLKNGNRSPGAIDNAGSVGIVLELARTLPAEIPDDVELIFLSPGAEEDHMIGAMRWLERHAGKLEGRPVYTLNFDGAGNPGRLVVMHRYGFGKSFSRFLSGLVGQVAQGLGARVWKIVTPPAMGIDTIPFAHRGLESITFSSGSLGRGTLAVHSADDRPEYLDGGTLERVARLAAAVVKRLVEPPPQGAVGSGR